jgi:long-chain acyl-CoA synthetase
MDLREKRVRSLIENFELASLKYGAHTLFVFERAKVDYEISYKEFYEYACAMTRGFMHLGLGGKRVAIIGENCPEWIATYLASVSAGGVAVPIDVALSKEQLVQFADMAEVEVLAYSKTWAAFVEENADEFKNVKTFIKLADNEFDFKTAQVCKLERFMTAEQIAHTGNALNDIEIPEQDSERMSVMLFTSGTTGTSKIVMLSQRNICSVINDARKPLAKFTEDDTLLSVLPVHHTYELTCGIFAAADHGCTIAINDSIKHVTRNLKKYRPTGMAVVPLYVEVFYNSIMKNVRKQGIEKTFNMALKASKVADKLKIDLRKQLFGKVMEAFGGRLCKLVCGGAALRPELVDTFGAIGIEIVQGYGITECAPLVSVIPFGVYNPKSCGKVVESVQVFIDKENPTDEFGEIVVKGPNVMLGYYKNEQATKEVLSPKGWFYTGDYGYVDKNNYLYITGRKKNIIVLQDGKNVLPEEIEEYIAAIPHVKESVVVGREKDNDLAITAIVYPDFEYTESIGLKSKEEVYNAIREQINTMNRKLVGYKRVVSLEFLDEEFEKTPSKKIKRFLYK